jgi:hypothetical protein
MTAQPHIGRYQCCSPCYAVLLTAGTIFVHRRQTTYTKACTTYSIYFLRPSGLGLDHLGSIMPILATYGPGLERNDDEQPMNHIHLSALLMLSGFLIFLSVKYILSGELHPLGVVYYTGPIKPTVINNKASYIHSETMWTSQCKHQIDIIRH